MTFSLLCLFFIFIFRLIIDSKIAITQPVKKKKTTRFYMFFIKVVKCIVTVVKNKTQQKKSTKETTKTCRKEPINTNRDLMSMAKSISVNLHIISTIITMTVSISVLIILKTTLLCHLKKR